MSKNGLIPKRARKIFDRGDQGSSDRSGEKAWQVLAEFTLPDVHGSERVANEGAAAVMAAVEVLHLPSACLAWLHGAVLQAAQNAVENGQRLRLGLPVSLRILVPDPIDWSTQGWGYFLIEKTSGSDGAEPHPVVELFLYQEGSG